MLDEPDGLDSTTLAAGVAAGWGVRAASVSYLPVGFGSYHWAVDGDDGRRWFVTADPASAYARLERALNAAIALRAGGLEFVLAPVPTPGGSAVWRLDVGYVLSLYPMVDGEAGDFGPHRPEDRDEMTGLLGRLHAAAAPDVERAGLGLPGRDELRAALDELGRPWNAGPYGEPVRGLLAGRRQRIERMLGEYDRLAALLPGEDEWVVTHGEPHPGNVIRTADGLRLIDWDTVRLAPRERDLWLVAGGGGDPDALAFYRLRWTLADVAGFVADLRAPHGAGGDAGAAWTFLSGYLASPEA